MSQGPRVEVRPRPLMLWRRFVVGLLRRKTHGSLPPMHLIRKGARRTGGGGLLQALSYWLAGSADLTVGGPITAPGVLLKCASLLPTSLAQADSRGPGGPFGRRRVSSNTASGIWDGGGDA